MTKFGIEIEFAGRNKAEILRKFGEFGIDIIDNSRTHLGHDDHAWMLKYDGSLGSRGYEAVSPPLSFETDRQVVTNAMLALKAAGCDHSEDAGIHIHCDAVGMTPRQLSAVPRFVTKFEDVICRLATGGYERLRSGIAEYAKMLDPEMVRRLYRVRDEKKLARVWYGRDMGFARQVLTNESPSIRYSIVNMHSYFLRNTVEFRIFNYTDDPLFVQAWIALCHWIMEDARRGFVRSVGRSYPIGSMESGKVDEKKLMMRFQQILRYESGCPVEDWRLIRYAWRNSVPQPKSLAML